MIPQEMSMMIRHFVREGEGETWKDIKDTDLGLVFGAGLTMPARGNVVFVEARYHLGLQSVDGSVCDRDIKSSVFTSAAGFGF
jgi:hypothetical protein